MPIKRKTKQKHEPIDCTEDDNTVIDINSMFVIDKTANPVDDIIKTEVPEQEDEAKEKRKQLQLEREQKRKIKHDKDEKDEQTLSSIIFNQPEPAQIPSINTDKDESADSDTDITQSLQPAWNDIDDDTIVSKEIALQQTTRERLQERFEDASGCRPSWANKHLRKREYYDTKTELDSSDDEMQHLLLKKTKLTELPSTLRPSFISITGLIDANKSHKPDAAMRCIEFHPRSQLLLSAGMHKTLDVYQIDGKLSTRVQGVYIENFPIYSARFTSSGDEIILNSDKAHFFVYNLQTDKIQKIYEVRGHRKEYFNNSLPSPRGDVIAFLGKDGYTVLLSTRTKQWISDLKMNGTVRSVAFARNGELMLTGGSDGEVYVWDMNTRDCVNKFRDEGTAVIHSISASSGEQPSVAVGTASGIVNIYDSTCLYSTQTPKPIKTYKNLTTSITNLKFSPTDEILAFFSYRNKQAIRLAHTQTHTVFNNWPRQDSNFGYVNALDFSYNSKYIAVGNDLGRVMLFRLNHFLDN
ncbi:U3 small nucleolar RNA-associated protein 18-like [Oopsacas minuta]|uniref:U3 small nucleolar RNA-associated protein 18-like n=1 Tax=Oopsacas minuta TaxID=111878 RepID=A0AAV7KFB1_9METZ|nr:U3 small nucleolar RNA-associated protein 18-like [Oopsacas minuta]